MPSKEGSALLPASAVTMILRPCAPLGAPSESLSRCTSTPENGIRLGLSPAGMSSAMALRLALCHGCKDREHCRCRTRPRRGAQAQAFRSATRPQT
jgi:hypothetical protein